MWLYKNCLKGLEYVSLVSFHYVPEQRSMDINHSRFQEISYMKAFSSDTNFSDVQGPTLHYFVVYN
jgi:hypothetical protein